ncbi:G patch domain-containing protein 3-like [Glandiceps talaboti]
MATDNDGTSSEDSVYCVVRNIPVNFHSADLRNYFSQFIESKGFLCFHFRHRPEARSEGTKSVTFCCVTKLLPTCLDRFIKMYHGKLWVGKDGSRIPVKCLISRIKLHCNLTEYKTRGEQKHIPPERETFTKSDLCNLPELNPPAAAMPNGNVGTPTKVFLDLIAACRMPSSVIKKLGLVFPRTRSNRRYGNVPFDYGGKIAMYNDDETIVTATGEDILPGKSITNLQTNLQTDVKKQSPQKPEEDALHDDPCHHSDNLAEDSDEDNDTCEDWERHEALHDDVTQQERNTERLYEEEIELKWEKGGSGLVFYTDANYWDEQEGDFDERTADDWDVDMSVYYDPDGGDKDARDFVQMRLEQKRRAGIYDGIGTHGKIGKFETYTKGIGRKVMEKQGWIDGEGLGSSVKGIPQALENDGQNPKERKGFGYYGEKLNKNVPKVGGRRTAEDCIISTVYDDPKQTDPAELLLRSQHPWTLKYRHEIKFRKATDNGGGS